MSKRIIEQRDVVMAHALADYQKREMTTDEIAAKHGISGATLTVWAKKARLPLRGRGRRQIQEITSRNKLIVELAETLTFEATGRSFGISRQRVWRIVKRWKPVICPLTDDDLTGDIERVIMKTVTPYVDPSNPMLQLDELQAECRAKLAKIIDGGRLARCLTRGKVFAFVKTSFRNHVRSLVQKYAFTAKRTGVKPTPCLPLGAGCVAAAMKVQVIRLDDPDMGHQLGCDDDRFKQCDFLEELFAKLSPSDCAQLSALIDGSPTNGEVCFVDNRAFKAERNARRKLLRKCRAILIGKEPDEGDRRSRRTWSALLLKG